MCLCVYVYVCVCRRPVFTYVLGEHAHTSAHKCQRNVLGTLSVILYLILLGSWDGVFH